MDEAFFELPETAQRLVRTIEAAIDEAEPLLRAPGAPADVAFDLRQTRENYLPETIRAFVAVPRSKRQRSDGGRSALDSLLQQLSILDRAVKRDLERLASSKRSELAANARFLAERFDDRSTDIAQPGDVDVAAAPAVDVRRWVPADGSDPRSIVAFAGAKLQQVLPRNTELRSGGLFGMGAVEAAIVTVQRGGGTAFRYTLSAKSGILEASVAKLVHGTPVQTVNCSIDDWFQSLYDDLQELARNQSEMRDALARFVR